MQKGKSIVLSLMVVLSLVATSAQALQVESHANGVVYIGDAVSPYGNIPNIYLLEYFPNGAVNRVPLFQVNTVRVEVHGRNMVIYNAKSNGRFSGIVIERSEFGNHQMFSIGL